MAAQPSPLSAHDFHQRYDGRKPAFEYWFGEAIQKPMPTILHGIVQFIIATLLERAGWNTSIEVRLKVVRDAEPIPDVIAVRGKFRGAYPTIAPDLCIKILSPGDTIRRALEKATQYLAWGSECVWIIDPENRTAWTVSQEHATKPIWIAPGEALQIRDTSFQLDDLFAEVDRKLDLSPL